MSLLHVGQLVMGAGAILAGYAAVMARRPRTDLYWWLGWTIIGVGMVLQGVVIYLVGDWWEE